MRDYATNEYKNTENRRIYTSGFILCNDSFFYMVEKDYPPLTEAQKKDMSQIGIEWYNKIRENSLKEQGNGKVNSVKS